MQKYSTTFEKALGAVRQLRLSGYGLAPLHPTHAMIAAGMMAGGVSYEQACAIYAAMFRVKSTEGHTAAVTSLFLNSEQENIPFH